MSKEASMELALYADLLGDIKTRVRQAQNRAVLAVNAELVRLYWDIGRLILERQQTAGWGAGVIPRLSRDLRNELPNLKGFSERNIGYMFRLAREYDVPKSLQQPAAKLTENEASPILQQPAAKLLPEAEAPIVQRLVAQLPWFHNVLLMEKVKDIPTRLWYMQQTLENGWSRDTLAAMIKNRAHERQGGAVTIFASRLPAAQSALAGNLLRDPYIFDSWPVSTATATIAAPLAFLAANEYALPVEEAA